MPVPILMYHRIGRVAKGSLVPGHYVSPRAFDRQLRILNLLGFAPGRLDRMFEGSGKRVVLTFDDGYENFFSNAMPILQRRGHTATVFLVAGLIGRTNEWDEREGDVSERLMGLAQIRECMAQGMQFGSHTTNHADLPQCSEEQARCEISDSKRILQEMLGCEVESFCYPYGRQNPQVREMVREAGYKLACSVEKGSNNEATDPYELRRINIRQDTSVLFFVSKLFKSLRNVR